MHPRASPGLASASPPYDTASPLRNQPAPSRASVLPCVPASPPGSSASRGVHPVLPRDRPTPLRDAATLVEAVPDGWWYSGPLPNGGLVVAFFSAPPILAATRAWHPDGWLALLQTAGGTAERAEAFAPAAAEPFVAAAGMARLDRAAGDGWLAVGDAAACHDPLTSHGIGHALHHGPLAAATILAHLHGDAAALPDWSARVAADHERCRALLRAVYALEDRWPDAPFWRSRTGSPPTS